MYQFFNVVILNCDGIPDKNGDFFDQTSIITCDRKDVPMTDGSGTMIGTANLRVHQSSGAKKFCVDLYFYDTPTLSMLEHVPCFFGTCLSRMVNHVLESKITSVCLCPENADPRIPKLKSYLGRLPETKMMKSNDCKCERLLNGHETSCSWAGK